MGVKNMWDILEPCKKTLPLHHLQNKRICIDLSCWIVQLHTVNKSRIAIQDKFYLRGLFHRVRALIALNCTIIFVIDGSIPAIKLSTYRQRLNSGTEVASDEHEKCSLRRNEGSQFSCMIKEAKILASALGITCLDGIEEAEAQCALLNSELLCDGIFTLDSDAFLFGARTVYRDICLGEGGYVVCYEMTDIETKLGFGRKSLIALALLLGGDYSQGVRGLGPESACQIVKSGGENNILEQIVKEGISLAKKKTKASKKQTQLNLSGPETTVNGINKQAQKQNQSQFLLVIDAYLRPKCHLANSEPVSRALTELPFQRVQLQRVCSQFFGWTPEKTDEYILPKIAERDLRRFANSRLTSSDSGANPPLPKIPIRCHVSCIVKTRKVQGKECFEVKWEGIEGLETSIVPSDLIMSACPEMITQFAEKNEAAKKHKNHRKPRKEKPPENTATTVTEIELKLQKLWLDIESETNTAPNAVDDENEEPPPFVEPQIGFGIDNSLSFCDVGSGPVEKDIVDLLSPSPAPRVRLVTRCREVGGPSVDVIDLSDSETEASPRHAHKAREFRSFLASLRDEL